MDKKLKTTSINIRMTPQEKKFWNETAAKLGTHASTLLRMIIKRSEEAQNGY